MNGIARHNNTWYQKTINFVLTRVAHNIHTTDKLVALEFPIELELRNADFWGGWKTEEPGENPRGKDKIQQQTQPTYDTGSRIWTRVIFGRRARSALRHPLIHDKVTSAKHDITVA